MDARGEAVGLFQGEARGEEGGFEEEVNQVLDGLVSLVGFDLLSQLNDDGVLGVDFESLLGGHVGGHRVVAEGLSLHDSLHVGGPSVLSSDEAAGRLDDALRGDDLLDLVSKDILDDLAEVLVGGLEFLSGLLLFLSLFELESFLGDVDELLSVVFLELLGHVLVDGVGQVENFESSLLEGLEER